MKNELITRFVKKTIRKTILFAFLMIVVASVAQAISPVVTNEMALGQMQNSNEAFILMNTYSKVRPIANAAYAGIIVWFTYTICCDVYKFTKAINAENKKEN